MIGKAKKANQKALSPVPSRPDLVSAIRIVVGLSGMLLPCNGDFMKTIIVIIFALSMVSPACAEKIGEVSTEFIMTGPNSKIVIEAFDDPLIPGVACHVSYPTKGGLKGALGLVEEKSEASIACRQVGAITLPGKLKDGDEVFSKSRSVLFKKLHVVRFIDRKRNVLVYLAFTDKLVDGSPKHSVSSVPIMPWSR